MDLSQRLKDIAISRSGFVFDPVTGVTFSVNPSGQFILRQLREGLDLEAVEASLRAAFDVLGDDDPARDVREFLLLLKEQGLVPSEAAPAPAGPAPSVI